MCLGWVVTLTGNESRRTIIPVLRTRAIRPKLWRCDMGHSTSTAVCVDYISRWGSHDYNVGKLGTDVGRHGD